MNQLLPQSVPQPSVRIERLEVDDLFGSRPVRIDAPALLFDHSSISILYGENGSGKTTVLNLLFHLLSPQDNQGHRSRIARVPFRRFLVRMSDGVEIEVKRSQRKLTGTYDIDYVNSDGVAARIPMRANAENKVHADEQANAAFLLFIKSCVPRVFYMADDRRFYTDELPFLKTSREHPAELHPRRRLRMEADHAVFAELDPMEWNPLAAQLHWLVERVADRARAYVFDASDREQGDALKIYTQVIASVVPSAFSTFEIERPDESSAMLHKSELFEKLEMLEALSTRLYGYGLVSPIDKSPFMGALRIANQEQLSTLHRILKPFLESLESRYHSLYDVYRMIDALVVTANEFLRHKQLRFSIRTGFSILGDHDNQLMPADLSSGEKHLLMLLTSAFLANESNSVFLVDEPEMSLNTTWQRRLVPALLACSPRANTQFLLATHSPEILAQYPSCVVEL